MVLLHTPPGEPGMTAKPFALPGVDGRVHRLEDYNAATVLVVMFLCNHCPYVQSVEERLIRLARDLGPEGAIFVGINCNDPVSYPEDSFDNMVKRAKEKRYPFDYLFDASQEVARAYGAVCTPDFFVFDHSRVLRYRGRLDDSPRNPAQVKQEEMKEAIRAILAGQPLQETQHPSMGCSIKWRGE